MDFEVNLNGNAPKVVQAVLAGSIWACKPASRSKTQKDADS
ncbi:MAG: hypothetical protein WC292_06720 [Clostridia bacterium]